MARNYFNSGKIPKIHEKVLYICYHFLAKNYTDAFEYNFRENFLFGPFKLGSSFLGLFFSDSPCMTP